MEYKILKAFATRHRLKLRMVADDDTLVIPGRDGEIFEPGGDMLAVLFMSPDCKNAGKWNSRKKRCLAVGMEVYLDGDFEGSFRFDPTDPKQAKVAIGVARAKPKRRLSAADKVLLASRLRASRHES